MPPACATPTPKHAARCCQQICPQQRGFARTDVTS
jgi:hypothetical protein